MQITRKIVEAKTPPRDIHVLWLDTSHSEGDYDILKNFCEGEWKSVMVDKDTLTELIPIRTGSGEGSAQIKGGRASAAGEVSFAEGHRTQAIGKYSHAEGDDTRARNEAEHAQGQLNVSNKASDTFGDAGNTIHSVGIGTSKTDRKNAFEIMQNGDVYVKGIGGYDGTNPANASTIKQVVDGKGTYSKPVTGIPSTDLASGVQSSLLKIDNLIVEYGTGTISEPVQSFCHINRSDLPQDFPENDLDDHFGSPQAQELYLALQDSSIPGSEQRYSSIYTYRSGEYDSELDDTIYTEHTIVVWAIYSYGWDCGWYEITDDCELLANKVTSISAQSTDTQYPSAKAVKTYVDSIVGNIETLLSSI